MNDIRKLLDILTETVESIYNNWVRHDTDTLKQDFKEYRIKEERKWRDRAERFGMRYPIFETFEDYSNAIKNAQVIDLNNHNISNMTAVDTIEDLEELVSTYSFPRDVNQIVSGIRNNDPIPYPVILKGKKGMHIMSGNTRQNVAKIMGAKRHGLLVDVSS